jgi:protein involved in polysaccharide export with SLBB domain
VRSPGKYTIPADTPFTLIELIARAGGFTDIGNSHSVRLSRKENDTTVTKIIDAQKFIQGKNGKETPPLLKDGDVINVPQNVF